MFNGVNENSVMEGLLQFNVLGHVAFEEYLCFGNGKLTLRFRKRHLGNQEKVDRRHCHLNSKFPT